MHHFERNDITIICEDGALGGEGGKLSRDGIPQSANGIEPVGTDLRAVPFFFLVREQNEDGAAAAPIIKDNIAENASGLSCE